MSYQLRAGLIGTVVGMLITGAAIILTTGSYKQRVDTNSSTIKSHTVRISENERDITGIEHDVESAEDMLREVRADVKRILHNTE